MADDSPGGERSPVLYPEYSGEDPTLLYDARPDLYDVQHDEEDDDLPFFAGLARRAGGPILELGCGTGRVLAALAMSPRRSRRPQVTGLDRSAAMLRAAQQRLRETTQTGVSLVEGDLRGFTLHGQYTLIICALNTFMELLTPEDQHACLRHCAAHLAPGGLLVIDVLNPYDALGEAYRGQLIHQFTRRRVDGSTVALASSSLVDATAQRIETYRQFDEWAPGRPVTRSTFTLVTRFTYRYEMEHLLARAGLALLEAYGDYDASPWSDEAARLIVLAGREERAGVD
jgi:SAM-dependent methyltransferase